MSKFLFRTAIALVAGAAFFGAQAQAAGFTELSLPVLNTDISGWTDGGTYNAVFPGQQTWNGVPFSLEDRQGSKVFTGGTLDIPVNIFGITSAYTIINSAWGSAGSTIGSVEFFGTNGAYFKTDLIEGVNVRDHYDGFYNNSIDGVNAVAAYNVGPGRARLDMQLYALPSQFQHETLETIRFTDAGGFPQGDPFIAAATVASVPEPETYALLFAGLGALSLIARRKNRTFS